MEKSSTRILIVDDDLAVLKAVKALVAAEEYLVEAVADPFEALKLFTEGDFAAVLTDIKMPGKTGIELMQQMSAIKPEVPVILHTGYAELETAIAALRSNAFDYITKPANPELLLHTLAQAVTFSYYRQLERNYKAQMEAEVTAKTLELSQLVRELKVARDQADAASRLKSEFMANMSHELRTPLHIILGMVEVLLAGAPDAQTVNDLQIIQKCTMDLNEIFDDVLLLAKLDAGQVNVNEGNFDLERLLRSVLDKQMFQAEAKGLSLIYRIQENIPCLLYGDSFHLETILKKLIQNALKFTEHGGTVLLVSLEELQGERVVLCFSVSDTGIGIPSDKQEDIFESFRQADGSLTRRHGGIGAGLAIVRKLVHLLDGNISLKSAVGEGSTFIFTAKFKRQR